MRVKHGTISRACRLQRGYIILLYTHTYVVIQHIKERIKIYNPMKDKFQRISLYFSLILVNFFLKKKIIVVANYKRRY